MAKQIKPGEKAPDFKLPDTDLKPQSLKEHLGKKVALAFYVGAFTLKCTKETCEFRDSMCRIIDSKAQVVGISEKCPFCNKTFAEKNRLPFPVLSDCTREVFKTYGLETTDSAGLKGDTVTKKSLLLLDKDGIIRFLWVSDDPWVEPDYDEVENALEQIK